MFSRSGGVMSFSHVEERRSARRPVVRWVVLAFLLGTRADAQEFNLRQIADDNFVNREAVLGDTGQAVWIQYDTSRAAMVKSDVIVWKDGERRNLTGEYENFMGNDKPAVDGNAVAWIASYRSFDGGPNWVLKEVPERDVGTPELPAIFRIEITGDGEPRFVPIEEKPELPPRGETAVTAEDTPTRPLESAARRLPSGVTEVNFWPGTGEIQRLTIDLRHDMAVSLSGRLVAFQKERGFPFGWEIMVWDDGTLRQLTTNFYYDMGPRVHGRQVVWYGWDGDDFEIFLYDADRNETIAITSNRYDDVSPVIWDGQIAWEGYPAVEADVYLYRQGQILKISDSVEDDINPRIWNGQVVWQSFDGDDFEIYLFDGVRSIKVTANNYDDVHPEIRDGLIVWMGYEGNMDAEIFVWDGKGRPVRLTENDEEDRDPRTAGGRVIWTVDRGGRGQVWLAEPR